MRHSGATFVADEAFCLVLRSQSPTPRPRHPIVTGARRERPMQAKSSASTSNESRSSGTSESLVKAFHGVRYQVSDVSRAVAFYTGHLGFKLEHQQLPAFANVSLGELRLLLSGPAASGSRPMPSGERQQPGGWNRVVLRV